MQLSTRGITVLVALTLSWSAIAAPPPGFAIDDPRHARLRTLETEASTLFDSEDFALSMSKKTRDAWAALHDAAMQVKVAGHPHPLAGIALIKLGSMDQIDGLNPSAIAQEDKGLALLAPFRDAYPIPWLEGMSVKGYVQSTTGDVAAGVATLTQANDYADRHFAKRDPKSLDQSDHMLRSNIAFALAQALSRLGRNSDAVTAQRRSMEERVAAVGPTHADAVAAYYNYAQMLFRADRNAEAEKYARFAVDTAADHIDRKHPAYARSLEMLGLILSRTGRRAESLDYLQRSIAIKRETMGTKSLYFHFALHNLGGILMPLERYQDAEALFLEAERGFRAIEGDASPQAARALAYAGAASLAEGRPGEAIDRLRTAMARVQTDSKSDRDMGQRVYPVLVPALIETGQDQAALAAARDYATETRQLDNSPAFALANAAMLAAWAQQRSGADWQPAAIDAAGRMVGLLRDGQSLNDNGELTDDQRTALDAILSIAVTTRNPALGLDAMAILAGSRIAQANRLVAERLVADPALALRVRTLQDKVKASQAADNLLLKALATDSNVDAARTAHAVVEADLAAERAGLSRDYPRWVETRGGARPDLSTLQTGLAPAEALLAVMPAFDGVYLLAVGRDRALIERAPPSRAAMVAMIDRLRGSLTPTGFDSASAHSLYGAIFTPGIVATLGDARSLRIVPT
ncbi:MAG: tetratricopeptide repeat protein, partial [bacterium]|nr:tetratricopeptide repeat protein [bacterium]